MRHKGPKKLSRKTAWNPAPLAALIGCVLVLGALLQQRTPERAQAAPAVQVVAQDDIVLLPVPVRAVARGERIIEVPFTTVRWPQNSASEAYLQTLSAHQHHITTASLPARLPVPLTALSADISDSNAVVEKIPIGMRAITVRVDDESAVEGWAHSGSYVDVIVIRKSASNASGLASQIIAENVRILSAGRSTRPVHGDSIGAKAPTTVTLLVTQEDALRIKTAASIGKLTFSLRGHGDQDPSRARALSQHQLLGAKARKQGSIKYQGTARGPDGKVYLLVDDRRWIQKLSANKPDTPQQPLEENSNG